MASAQQRVFLQKWLRVHMERDPIVLFSCTLGLFAFTVPWIVGDGGRKREEMGTNYAYRIKSVYPKGS